MLSTKHIPSNQKIPVKTSLGVFILEISARGLYRVHFPKRYPILEPGSRMGGFLDKLLVGMKPDLSGFTKFQLRVYSTLRKVPAGTILTYGELASRAGFPGAARAVGTAMRKNRLPIMIPCHRVLPASGGLGKYSAGEAWKRWLLEYEGSISRSILAARNFNSQETRCR